MAFQNGPASDSLVHYMEDVGGVPLLDREEECRLAVAAVGGDRKAKATLVVSNLRFVVKIAHQYAGYGVPLSDLVQEGNLGLIQAVEKFDPSYKARLTTYASWWIKAYITKFIISAKAIVKLGTTQVQRKLFFALRRAEAAIMVTEGRIDDEAIARMLDVTAEDVVEMRQRLLSEVSLDDPVEHREGGSTRLIDLLAAHDRGPEETLAAAEREAAVREAVADLIASGRFDDRCAYIIRRRLLTDDPESLAEIGERFGVSRERVRQVEKTIIAALRKRLGDLVADEPA